MDDRRYCFSWGLLGDVQAGRPNLGPTARVEAYRLMHFSLRSVLEELLGTSECDAVLFAAGQVAGRGFHQQFLGHLTSQKGFLQQLSGCFEEMGLGILRVEHADLATGKMVLTVAEDLDCSGLPNLGHTFCAYSEGFISGLLGNALGRRFAVTEVECWCTGQRICRFCAEAVDADGEELRPAYVANTASAR